MKTEHGIIMTVGILVFISLGFIAYNPNSSPYDIALTEINDDGIKAKKAEDSEKLTEQAMLMQKKITRIASDSLGLNIFMSDSFQSYFQLQMVLM